MAPRRAAVFFRPARRADPAHFFASQRHEQLAETQRRQLAHTQESLIRSTGLAPADDAEAAIVRSFMPGNYTAVVRGKDGGSGVALVEVYNLQ